MKYAAGKRVNVKNSFRALGEESNTVLREINEQFFALITVVDYTDGARRLRAARELKRTTTRTIAVWKRARGESESIPLAIFLIFLGFALCGARDTHVVYLPHVSKCVATKAMRNVFLLSLVLSLHLSDGRKLLQFRTALSAPGPGKQLVHKRATSFIYRKHKKTHQIFLCLRFSAPKKNF